VENVIAKLERLSRRMNTVAHHYGHADQVRKDAIAIAKDEGLDDREVFMVEVAALWHDIGLDYVNDRSEHPDKASEMFLDEFGDSGEFTNSEKETIRFLLKYHDKYLEASKATTDGKLLKMLRVLIDADTLELLGRRGYERAVETAESKNWAEYNPLNPLGETCGFGPRQFDERFISKKKGEITDVIEPSLVGQLNFQISCGELLYTRLAKSKGAKGVDYLKEKIVELVGND